jgi:hypothetical protein
MKSRRADIKRVFCLGRRSMSALRIYTLPTERSIAAEWY